jgi:hypothetical protein
VPCYVEARAAPWGHSAPEEHHHRHGSAGYQQLPVERLHQDKMRPSLLLHLQHGSVRVWGLGFRVQGLGLLHLHRGRAAQFRV